MGIGLYEFMGWKFDLPYAKVSAAGFNNIGRWQDLALTQPVVDAQVVGAAALIISVGISVSSGATVRYCARKISPWQPRPPRLRRSPGVVEEFDQELR